MDDLEPGSDTPVQPVDPDIEHVMKCVFGIKPHELRLYRTLSSRPGSTVSELASVLERDESSVNRSLSTLAELDLLDRERRLLEGGGYVYQYYTGPSVDAKRRLQAGLEEWVTLVSEEVESLDI